MTFTAHGNILLLLYAVYMDVILILNEHACTSVLSLLRSCVISLLLRGSTVGDVKHDGCFFCGRALDQVLVMPEDV